MTDPHLSPAAVATALEQYYGFSPPKAQALAQATMAQIPAPFDFSGMAEVAGRLSQALRRRQALLIFGDFDTDGITGSAILYRACSRYSDQVQRYTPFYREDYGLHPHQVERFAAQGIELVATVDTGVTAHQAIERAHQLGLQVLVTDHHLPREELGLPDVPVLNPEDHLLSGAQLAYLTARGVEQEMEGRWEHDPWGLTLSALGGQVDCVAVDRPSTRAWVAAGHRFLNGPQAPQGLQVLRQVVGERYTPSEMRSLGSMLNMAKRSRQVDPNEIVQALLPETADDRRREIFAFLYQERDRVGQVASAVTGRAMEDVRPEIGQPGILIYQVHVPDPTVSEVEGPLASRLASYTRRPTLVLRPAEKKISFSGRVWGKFSFASFLEDPAIQAAVIQMGGHAQAIGGSLRPSNRPAFLRAVRQWEGQQPPAAERRSEPRHPTQVLERLDPTLALLLGRAVGPFGQGLRPLRFRTTLWAKGGWAFSGDVQVELNRSLSAGEWEVIFTFDEAGCDGSKVALRVHRAWESQ